jgi:hypothetical protein
MGAVAVDLGYVAVVKAFLQTSADAAATAAVHELPVTDQVKDAAVALANENEPWDEEGGVLDRDDVEPGHWSDATGTFTSAGSPLNAVRVTTKHDATLMFARGLGFGDTSAVAAVAVATRPLMDNGGDARFLIDNEMFDTGISIQDANGNEKGKPFEDLANDLGVSVDSLLEDADNDWFIDLPAGTVLELPTGQVGDPGLFEVKPGLGFPFSQTSDPTLEDFLNYQESCSCWRDDPDVKALLDPLDGVIYVEDPTRYPEFVNPDAVLVSPVYASDVNRVSPEQVNALGERRGLVAFSIIGIGDDPPGSYLPNVIIRVRDPATITLSDVGIGTGGGGGVGGLVRLVK